jgi:hypothetical protein
LYVFLSDLALIPGWGYLLFRNRLDLKKHNIRQPNLFPNLQARLATDSQPAKRLASNETCTIASGLHALCTGNSLPALPEKETGSWLNKDGKAGAGLSKRLSRGLARLGREFEQNSGFERIACKVELSPTTILWNWILVPTATRHSFSTGILVSGKYRHPFPTQTRGSGTRSDGVKASYSLQPVNDSALCCKASRSKICCVFGQTFTKCTSVTLDEFHHALRPLCYS